MKNIQTPIADTKTNEINNVTFFRHSCESRNPDAVPAKAGNYKGNRFPFTWETLDSRLRGNDSVWRIIDWIARTSRAMTVNYKMLSFRLVRNHSYGRTPDKQE